MDTRHMLRFGHRPGATRALEVPCGPLGDWLRLLHMESIDYFSLDVVVLEFQTLQIARWPIPCANTTCVPTPRACQHLRLPLCGTLCTLGACVQVEGAELLVLSTLDWSRLSVGVLIAECARAGCHGGKDLEVARLLEARGMKLVAFLKVRSNLWNAAYVNVTHIQFQMRGRARRRRTDYYVN